MTIALRAAPRRAPLLFAALLLGVAACSSPGSGTPPPSGACLRADAQNRLAISARNTAFNVSCMEAEAGRPIVITFTNQEAVPHNVTVFRDQSKAEELVRGETITGPDRSTTVTVPAQAPGQLFFECSIHTSMNGALVLKGSAS